MHVASQALIVAGADVALSVGMQVYASESLTLVQSLRRSLRCVTAS